MLCSCNGWNATSELSVLETTDCNDDCCRSIVAALKTTDCLRQSVTVQPAIFLCMVVSLLLVSSSSSSLLLLVVEKVQWSFVTDCDCDINFESVSLSACELGYKHKFNLGACLVLVWKLNTTEATGTSLDLLMKASRASQVKVTHIIFPPFTDWGMNNHSSSAFSSSASSSSSFAFAFTTSSITIEYRIMSLHLTISTCIRAVDDNQVSN